jgi:hypothetical protein
MAMLRDRNLTLAGRIRQIRLELFGPYGSPALADALGIPNQTLLNYESGVALPAHTVLALIEQTGVNPHWLLTGESDRYMGRRYGDRFRRAVAP